MPPPEPRTSPPDEAAQQASLSEASWDGLHPLTAEPDVRELSEDERAASWLHAGLGFEVG